jgi:hypothetical protein
MHATANGQVEAHRRNGRVIPKGTPAAPPLSPVKTAPPPADGQSDAQPAAGQDPATGRFLPGNKCAKGNPHYCRAAALRSAFASAITEDEIRQLARTLYEQAKAGDTTAAGLLLSYAIGKPGPAPDPDRCDLDEFRLLADHPSRAEVLVALLDSVNPAAVTQALQLLARTQAEEPPGELLLDIGRNALDRGGQFDAEREARRRRRK